MSERRGGRRACLVLAAALGVALAGCARIPTSGPVRAGGDLRVERGEDVVLPIGQPPRRGAGPAEIVAGFLQSSADFQSDHAVARQYLTPAAGQRWRPERGTVVYDPSGVPTLPGETPVGGSVVVTAAGAERGRIAADGRFSRSAPDAVVSRQFRVQRVEGQWRIAQLPDGLLLTTSDVRESYRPVALYFLAPGGGTLVPDTVLLPELPGLTTKVVVRLLRGPTSVLRGAVTTAFPEGTSLVVPSVPVRDGVASVQLDAQALQADDQAREQMSAQLVWTLKQLSGVLRVKIRAGGKDLTVPGASAEQPTTAWPQYDPDLLAASPTAYAVVGGRVGRYVEGKFVPVGGGGGGGDARLRSPAVSLDGQQLAVVSADGRTLQTGRLAPGSALVTRLRGGDLSAPSWDRENNLWVVDWATGRLLYLAEGTDQPQQVQLPAGLSDGALRAVSVARDGARLALLRGTGRASALLVAGISRVDTADSRVPSGQLVSLVGLREPVPGLRWLSDVGWADATQVVALGSLDGAASRPYLVAVDGFEIRDVEPLAGLVTVSAAPPQAPQGPPLVAGTRDGQLAQYTSSDGWTVLGPGADPAYPG